MEGLHVIIGVTRRERIMLFSHFSSAYYVRLKAGYTVQSIRLRFARKVALSNTDFFPSSLPSNSRCSPTSLLRTLSLVPCSGLETTPFRKSLVFQIDIIDSREH